VRHIHQLFRHVKPQVDILMVSEKRFSLSISQFIISTCEAVTTTTERDRRPRSLFNQFSVCPAPGDVLQCLLRFVNQRQPLFP
jgi:hypothetical protein